MTTIDEKLIEWQKENFNDVYHTMKEALKDVKEERDVVKQKYCANYFGVSVNTLKSWVHMGCPEIRLESGMVLYSKQGVRKWLLQYQK
ncbi:terminase small subunit [Enterococcus hulanensis]|uniref:terminase small subunit n=1 Tax=Enterococcus hulanensis TaxID=2559929 RepID=UPI0010F89C8B|nr:terminase small subunit [Enterococcus hulanensis]